MGMIDAILYPLYIFLFVAGFSGIAGWIRRNRRERHEQAFRRYARRLEGRP